MATTSPQNSTVTTDVTNPKITPFAYEYAFRRSVTVHQTMVPMTAAEPGTKTTVKAVGSPSIFTNVVATTPNGITMAAPHTNT